VGRGLGRCWGGEKKNVGQNERFGPFGLGNDVGGPPSAAPGGDGRIFCWLCGLPLWPRRKGRFPAAIAGKRIFSAPERYCLGLARSGEKGARKKTILPRAVSTSPGTDFHRIGRGLLNGPAGPSARKKFFRDERPEKN